MGMEIPGWLSRIDFGTIVGTIAFVGVLAGVFWRVLKPAAKVLRNLETFLEDWNGREPRKDANGVTVEEGKPGVHARLIAVEEKVSDLPALRAQVDRIHYETKPNHGGSLKDAIVRIETEQQEQRGHIEALYDLWGKKPHTGKDGTDAQRH